jgi:hypothetical protein
MRRIYVDKYVGSIERTDLYLVKLTLKDGTVYENLEPRRLFPFNNPDMYITLLNREEREVGFVRDLSELDEGSVAALQECFAEYYMIPKVTRLITAEERFGSIKWCVMTDRGEISFRIRSRHSDIKKLYGSNRVILRDSNDNRYEIEDYTKLDAHSLRLLFSYL